jgi:hypothetical protein
MAFEKILILESTWADADEYISDSRSTTKIYSGLESLMSVQEKPVYAIHRPLLSFRYIIDIKQFLSLPSNRRGINVIILSAHGKHKRIKNKGKFVHRRELCAIDGKINISKEMRSISNKLHRTVIILDACSVGESIYSFKKASGALGVVGFSETVDWIDSSAFILALLLKYQEGGVFQMQRSSSAMPKKVLEDMTMGPYKTLCKSLCMEHKFI